MDKNKKTKRMADKEREIAKLEKERTAITTHIEKLGAFVTNTDRGDTAKKKELEGLKFKFNQINGQIAPLLEELEVLTIQMLSGTDTEFEELVLREGEAEPHSH